jgi:hypothetical protein
MGNMDIPQIWLIHNIRFNDKICIFDSYQLGPKNNNFSGQAKILGVQQLNAQVNMWQRNCFD